MINSNSKRKTFRGDESRLWPISTGFECGEVAAVHYHRRHDVDEDEDDTDNEDEEDKMFATVTFYCNLYGETNKDLRLYFQCREPSCGVLFEQEQHEQANNAVDPIDDGDDGHRPWVDPNFFDAGYTLAGKTGFQVWPGSRLLIETLSWPIPTTTTNTTVRQKLLQWQQRLFVNTNNNANNNQPSRLRRRCPRPLHVLELGAGVGVVGTCLAYHGAHVLSTDLPTLVRHSLQPNLRRNRNSKGDDSDTPPPKWLQEYGGTPMAAGTVVRIGQGWAGTAALDWTVPLDQQFLNLGECFGPPIDLIVASDCVWLRSMLDALLNTVAAIFDMQRLRRRHQAVATTSDDYNDDDDDDISTMTSTKFIMSFQRRDPKEQPQPQLEQESGSSSNTTTSQDLFTTVDQVLAEVKARQWTCECLAWRPVYYPKYEQKDENEDSTTGQEQEEMKEVFVFEIAPQQE